MRASFWFGATFAGLSVILAVGWYRERQRAETANAQSEQMAVNFRAHQESISGVTPPTDPMIPESNELRKAYVKLDDSLARSYASDKTTGTAIARLPENPVVNKPAESLTIPSRAIASSLDEQRPYTAEQEEVYRCSNQMLEINVATARWAANHNGQMPSNLSDLRGYIAPMMLVCPSVRPVALATTWDEFSPTDVSYRTSPNAIDALWDFGLPQGGSPPSKTWLLCPIHRSSTRNRVMPGGIPVDLVFKGSK
jgi:hypothetical protein